MPLSDPSLAPALDVPAAHETRATVLFADILGFTELSEKVGPESAYLAVSGALRLLDGVARRHGGSVDKYLGDALMVVFGHPVPVAEPAAAALRTALEMREQLREYGRNLAVPLDLVVGVNTGPVVAGDVRGRVIREFHVLGDTVNVAARLKARAPRGAVYLGEATQREAGNAFECRSLGRMNLKGKVEEVAIFDLVRSRERAAGAGLAAPHADGARFVGRARERATLAAGIARVARGAGGVLLVVGDEGSGKSRLLAQAPAVPGVAAIHVRSGGGGVVEELLDALDTDAARAAAATLRAAAVHPRDTVKRVADALAASAPLAVGLEDLHRADRAALALLADVVECAAPRGVLFVATARPHGADDDLARCFAALGAETLVLEPLGPDDCRALLASEAPEPLGAASEAHLLARAGGNPGRLLLGVHLEPALRVEREHRQHGERTSDTERRRATVLFADISGFTAMTERMGAARAYPLVVDCLRLLEEVARKHGGTVEKYLGDCVLALFGVAQAIEDAPRAAVNAAIEMRRRVREYGARLGGEADLDVHSGVETGIGIAGDVSGPLLREFAVMGDSVSVADALKDLAPAGAIYAGPEVERATREVFAYRALDAGELAPTPRVRAAHEVLSQQERLHRARIGAERRLFSRLVGRERELALLRDALARLRGGAGGIVSIVAEAGLGKSRLLAELATSEEAAELAWREGRAVSTGQHASFHPIADLCRSWAGIGDDDDEDGARAKLHAVVRRALHDEADEALPFVATLIGLPPDERAKERLDGIDGGALEKLILRSVVELLRGGSRVRPLVVVMDDLHWADVSSIELLLALLPLCEDHPILFVNVFRPGFARTSDRIRAQSSIDHASHHLEIELGPLDANAALALLNNLFRQGDIPHAARERIAEKARGNPFYIEEVVRALVDTEAVVAVDGRFRATERIHDVVIPGTVQEVIMARVDGQPLRKRRMLQTASVIGGTFHLDVLAAVVEEPDRLADDLADLLQAEFIVPSDRLPGEEYAFKHPLIHEVTYDALVQVRREELHRLVANATERTLSPELPGYSGMLAYHYGKSGDVARAEEFLFRAGDEAARAAASGEALHFFEEASKLYLARHGDGGDPAKHALLESRVAKALYFRGRFLDAIDHFDRALEFLGDRVGGGRVRTGLRFAANLAVVLARLYGPGFAPRRIATDRQREVFALRYARAEATVTTLPTRHIFDSMDGLALLQRIDPRSVPRSGMFYAGCAALFAFGGISFDVSRRLGARAGALVRDDDPDEVLYERAMRFTARVLEGDWSTEHEIEPERIADSLRRGQLWGPTTYLGLLGEKRIHRGEYDAAVGSIEQIDAIRDSFRYDLAKTNTYYLRSLLPLERGDLEDAVVAADAYYDHNPEDLLHILALGAKAKAQTLLGDLDAAEETLRHAGDLVASSGPVPPFHASVFHRSRLLLDVTLLESTPPAQRALRRSRRDAVRRSSRVALRSAARVAWRRTEVYRLAARGRWLVGDRNGALRLLRRSLAAGEALGAQPEIGRTCEEFARRLLQSHASTPEAGARELALRAHAIYEERGMESDLARAKSLIRQVDPA